jgi:hypothetical protein
MDCHCLEGTGERYLTPSTSWRSPAIAAAKNAGVKLPRIRSAIGYAQECFRADRPLLLERSFTDGRDLYLREIEPSGLLHVNASQAGQIAFPYIAAVLRHLEYEGERPVRWWPVGQERAVLVDPRVGFGQPLIYPSGIRTETVVDRFLADEPMEGRIPAVVATRATISCCCTCRTAPAGPGLRESHSRTGSPQGPRRASRTR